MKKSLPHLQGQNSQKINGLVFALVFAIIGVCIVTFTRAATVGTLSLTPASSSVSQGSNFTVKVMENSLTDPVNAVQADLTYDQTKLQFVSIDTTGTGFGVEAQNTGGSGKVSLARGSTSPVTGSQTVASVTFKAIGSGATTIQFANTSVILTSSNNTNILSTASSGTYTITDTSAPTVPTNLTAGASSATSVNLTWTASTDNVAVTGYNIYRNGSKVGTSATTSYVSNGLTPSTSYSFTVSAYDAAGNTSAQTAAVQRSTVADTAAPTVPASLAAGSRTLTSIPLTWTASTDNVAVTGYNIYRNGSKVGTSATTSYTDTGLTPGTSYSYTISAYDAAGNTSAQTSALAISTLADGAAPATPGGLSIASQTATSVNLTWTASTDNVAVTGYNIYRNGSKVGTSATTSYTDTGLSTGVNYTYTISAYDKTGNTSAQSSGTSVTLHQKTGDVTGDGKIDINDLSILAASYSKSVSANSSGDLNGDGVVNVYDLSILCSNWNK